MHFYQFLPFVSLIASMHWVVAEAYSPAYGPFHLPKRQSQRIAVTGVQSNATGLRMELRTMAQDYPDMFNIYLLGLRSFMNTNQSDPLSYYQVAGIHGRPYTAWNDVGTAPGYGGGYCTHASNLFLPWHRPYVALYEQALYAHLQTVANTFPYGATRDKYVAAAAQWRLPYWDWAAAPCSTCNDYPLLVSQLYVQVTTPTGNEWVLNPLFRYDFNPLSTSDMVYTPYSVWTVTKRYPTNWTVEGLSQNDLISPIFVNNQVSLRDRLYNLFTGYSNFTQFGNEAWMNSDTINADSLESVHDAIHGMTGMGGHMNYLDYAAFDPIFWLHHAMIDRCFALWQVLYPDSYVEPMDAVGSTFTYPAGTSNDVNSPLLPFFSDISGTNWTSARVVNTTTFGYTYPELLNGSSSANVMAAINTLYGDTAGSTTVSSNSKRLTTDNVDAAEEVQSAVSDNGTSHQYITNIVSQRFAMNASFSVYIFLGNYSENSSTWASEPNMVGLHAVFANLANDDASSVMGDVKVTGSVPLTTALVDKVATNQLASLAPADVETYLTSNLDWRVAYFDGQEIPLLEVPDLSVSVVQSQVQPASSTDSFPVWGDVTMLVNITADRIGGYNRAYWN